MENVQAALLAWYDRAARSLAWRISPADRAAGSRPDPYRVWLSEIMLQQTTTAAVAPYFAAFTSRWPRIEDLAAAPRDDVLAAWAGLGYYSRARNLHAAAIQLAAQGFPADEAGWRAIPGVGPYTAAAIAAIAYDQPANVVDGNVERVMARLFAVETPVPAAKSELRTHAGRLAPLRRPGDWAQALMDLGATICTPRSPRCGDCPIAPWCAARAGGAPADYPRRVAKAAKPARYGVAFALRAGGRMLLVRRPDAGLLGGMRALPTTPWRETPWSADEAAVHAPAAADWRPVGAVRHVFTHFALDLDVWVGEGPARAAVGDAGAEDGTAEAGTAEAGTVEDWADETALDAAGLPTVFAKAAARALAT